ncbi:uncharacterized protein L203_101236 [Cryptococcus depauperatus CBS 7841]|uniref:Uncharacterized protein n=1 Tax=Cryptococcus depauperatus CBS 7841 TaxID=1295531 RepID=A0AAJ8JPI2_9TREE
MAWLRKEDYTVASRRDWNIKASFLSKDNFHSTFFSRHHKRSIKLSLQNATATLLIMCDIGISIIIYTCGYREEPGQLAARATAPIIIDTILSMD